MLEEIKILKESNFQHSEKISFIFNDQSFEVYRFVLGIDKKLIQKLEFFDEYYQPNWI